MNPDHAGNGGGSPPEKPDSQEICDWELILFVAGQSPKSLMAYANLKKVCESHLRDRHTLRLVDLAKEPGLAKQFQVVAVPTLIREIPEPRKRVIGSLSNLDRLMADLDLHPH